ncbi:MAG: hypothetical protein JEY94_07155 [Melioribacteraceae bacterium]|nr:hypothetical protein [Melioribacteraceae bacterium]
MKELLLFTDGSVNTKTKVGYGARIIVFKTELCSESVKVKVLTKRFEDTSSTKLEIETLLWALRDIPNGNLKIIIYTDSQNIIGLEQRRSRLEKNSYYSKNNKLLKNHELYKEFYRLTDKLDCEFIKVAGHQKKVTKNEIDNIFTLVDKASRRALREDSNK